MRPRTRMHSPCRRRTGSWPVAPCVVLINPPRSCPDRRGRPAMPKLKRCFLKRVLQIPWRRAVTRGPSSLVMPFALTLHSFGGEFFRAEREEQRMQRLLLDGRRKAAASRVRETQRNRPVCFHVFALVAFSFRWIGKSIRKARLRNETAALLANRSNIPLVPASSAGIRLLEPLSFDQGKESSLGFVAGQISLSMAQAMSGPACVNASRY